MSPEISFEISGENIGMRIDKCVALKLGEAYSRMYAKNLIEKGLILVNGSKVKAHYIAREGDSVHVELAPQERSDIEPENIPLKILYEDEWIIVVDKAAGMVVHPGCGNKKGTMAGALLYHCKDLPDGGNPLRPGIVHRLDKDTSGIVVVAKNDRAMRSLARQFQKRCVKKVYVALVSGDVEFDNGVVEASITRHKLDRKKMEVTYDEEEGKNARTVYHVVKRFKGFTFLRLELETGRTHQVRVHMKHIGHPVLGDSTYGKRGNFRRQLLHAEMLGFTHPDTGKYMEFKSPIPDDIMSVIEKGEI